MNWSITDRAYRVFWLIGAVGAVAMIACNWRGHAIASWANRAFVAWLIVIALYVGIRLLVQNFAGVSAWVRRQVRG